MALLTLPNIQTIGGAESQDQNLTQATGPLAPRLRGPGWVPGDSPSLPSFCALSAVAFYALSSGWVSGCLGVWGNHNYRTLAFIRSFIRSFIHRLAHSWYGLDPSHPTSFPHPPLFDILPIPLPVCPAEMNGW